MDISKATPTLWRVGINPGPIVYGNSGEQIASFIPENCMVFPEEGNANAELICLAVNSYGKHSEALEYAKKVFEAWKHDANPYNDLQPGDSMEYDAACIAFDKMDEALKEGK